MAEELDVGGTRRRKQVKPLCVLACDLELARDDATSGVAELRRSSVLIVNAASIDRAQTGLARESWKEVFSNFLK
jgi:hypothetical protein